MSVIDEKFYHLSTKLTTEKHKSTLKDEIITEELKILHNKFFVIPNSKARGNVAFICQRHYAKVFINELGLNNVNNETTYKKATKPLDKTVAENTSFLKRKFHLVVTEIIKIFLIYTGFQTAEKSYLSKLYKCCTQVFIETLFELLQLH